jgi:hypothetical protein
MTDPGLESLLAPGGRVIKFGAPVRGPGTPEQLDIGPGDCFISTPGPLFPSIYGRVWTRRDFVDDLRSDNWDNPGPLKLESELAWREYRYSLGYRWSTCYSVAELEGEDGETHVSTCRKISFEEFAEAMSRGWE